MAIEQRSAAPLAEAREANRLAAPKHKRHIIRLEHDAGPQPLEPSAEGFGGELAVARELRVAADVRPLAQVPAPTSQRLSSAPTCSVIMCQGQ